MQRLPLSEQKVINNLSRSRLETIVRTITSRWEEIPEPGLMTGLTGVATLLFHYGRSQGSDRIENLGYLALEKALGSIDKGFNWPSFATGLAGMRFALHHLGEQQFINQSEASALDTLEPLLFEFALRKMKEGEYNYLHGGLGYLLGSKSGSGSEPNVTQLISLLMDHSIAPRPGQIAWEAHNPKTGQAEINLGLAHGVPGIMLLMAGSLEGRNPKLGGAGKEQSEMMVSAVNSIFDFLMDCRLEKASNGSLFPHRMVEGKPDKPGRLAWCYGDPGVGAALWQTGLLMQRSDWQSIALEVLTKASMRIRNRENRIYDACLCHGTAGLALIFFKMAELTGHERLLEASIHWTRATLDYAQHPDAPAGYLFLGPGNKYVPNLTLLEGITGVGLALNTLINGETGGWETAMLL